MSDDAQPNEFESVKNRLAEIAEAVDDENLPLDDALDLYEEAVALGLQASDLLETGIAVPEEEPESAAASEPARVPESVDAPAGAHLDAPGSPKANETDASATSESQPEQPVD